MGHEVLIQRGAGNNAYYGDTEYADAGAMIVETLGEVYTADVVLKATSVSAGDTVYMHDRQVILSPLKLCDMRKDAITEMMQKKVTAVGFDILKDGEGYYPVVRIMSEIAGNSAIMIASEYLNNSRGGKGIVLGGISGITPAEIVILGAGTLGEFAARAALGLGATVKIFDHSVDGFDLTDDLAQAAMEVIRVDAFFHIYRSLRVFCHFTAERFFTIKL